MSHSIEDFYQKAALLHEKAIALHRERYKTQGTYDRTACQALLDDVRHLAYDLQHGLIDMDIDFGKQSVDISSDKNT